MRIDERPELLFTLRGVSPRDLLSGEDVVAALCGDQAPELSALDTEELGDLFGVTLSSDPDL
jgi:hypothetical protein